MLDAQAYIKERMIKSYEDNGFGLYKVELKFDGKALGILGFVKRPTLKNVDLGFAFLPDHCRKGYALEGSKAALDFAKVKLKLKILAAITALDNEPSIALLKKLGFTLEGPRQLDPTDPKEILFFSYNL